MTIYHIARWNEIYENNRSRTVKDLDWVPIPNKHDGEQYSRLMRRKDAAQIFAAWILILEVASRCHPRGTLLRSGGTPHDPESLSIKTRAPEAWFEMALPVLAEIGWLDVEKHEQSTLALSCQEGVSLTDTCLSGSRQSGVYEGKGREGKGIQTALTRPGIDDWLGYGNQFEPGWPESDAKNAFDYYEANGWKQSGGAVVKNWQAALRTCVGRWRKNPSGGNGQRKTPEELAFEERVANPMRRV